MAKSLGGSREKRWLSDILPPSLAQGSLDSHLFHLEAVMKRNGIYGTQPGRRWPWPTTSLTNWKEVATGVLETHPRDGWASPLHARHSGTPLSRFDQVGLRTMTSIIHSRSQFNFILCSQETENNSNAYTISVADKLDKGIKKRLLNIKHNGP